MSEGLRIAGRGHEKLDNTAGRTFCDAITECSETDPHPD